MVGRHSVSREEIRAKRIEQHTWRAWTASIVWTGARKIPLALLLREEMFLINPVLDSHHKDPHAAGTAL